MNRNISKQVKNIIDLAIIKSIKTKSTFIKATIKNNFIGALSGDRFAMLNANHKATAEQELVKEFPNLMSNKNSWEEVKKFYYLTTNKHIAEDIASKYDIKVGFVNSILREQADCVVSTVDNIVDLINRRKH